MTAVTTTPTNGVARPPFREQLADQIREEIARLDVRRVELADELDEINREIKSYEKSLAPLVGDPQSPTLGRPRGRPAGSKKYQSKIGAERLADIKAALLELAGDDDREFRQIDLTNRLGLSSGVAAVAFRQLREDEQFIRLARQEGGNKYYRLTRPALRDAASPPAQAPIRPPKDETRQTVLEAIRHHGRPATCTDLAELTGVGDVALRNAVHTLQAEGLVQDVGPAEQRADGATHGRMPRQFMLVDGTRS